MLNPSVTHWYPVFNISFGVWYDEGREVGPCHPPGIGCIDAARLFSILRTTLWPKARGHLRTHKLGKVEKWPVTRKRLSDDQISLDTGG